MENTISLSHNQQRLKLMQKTQIDGRNESYKSKEPGGTGEEVMDGLRRPKRNTVKPCRFKPARHQFTSRPTFTARKQHSGFSKPFLG